MSVLHGVRIPSQRALSADAASAALVEMAAVLGEASPRGWSRSRDGATAMVTGAPVAALNGVLCGRRGAVAAVSDLLDEVAAAGLPHCVEIRDGDAAVEMVARSRGLVEGDRVPLMVLEAVSFDAPDGDDGVRALGRDDDDVHLDLVVEGFEAPAEVFAAFRGGRLLRTDCARAYVVEADGRPVATALGMTIGDHVGVFDVATAPAYRGRGYGAALTARAVADGFEAGARAAVLQSSPVGVSVYARLGFRTVEHWTSWVSEPVS